MNTFSSDSVDADQTALRSARAEDVVAEMERLRIRLWTLVNEMERRPEPMLVPLAKLVGQRGCDSLDPARRILRVIEAQAAVRNGVRLPMRYTATFDTENDYRGSWRNWTVDLRFRDATLRIHDHQQAEAVVMDLEGLSDTQIHDIALTLKGIDSKVYESVSASDRKDELLEDLAALICSFKDDLVHLSQCRDETDQEQVVHPLEGAMLRPGPQQIVMSPT